MAFTIRFYSAADGSIPIEEEDTDFLKRKIHKLLYTPNRTIVSAISDCFTQETNTFTPNYWRPSRKLLKTKHYLNSVRFFYYPCMPSMLSVSKLLTPD